MNKKNISWIVKLYLVNSFFKTFMKFKGAQKCSNCFSFRNKEYSVCMYPDLSNIKAFSFLERKLFIPLVDFTKNNLGYKCRQFKLVVWVKISLFSSHSECYLNVI